MAANQEVQTDEGTFGEDVHLLVVIMEFTR